MNTGKIRNTTFFLIAVCFTVSNSLSYAGNVNFDGNDGYNFNSNTNIPMPGNPTPVNTGSNNNSNTVSKPKTYTNSHSKGSGYSNYNTTNILINSMIQGYQNSVIQAQQAELAKKLAEEQKKIEEAKKKKEAEEWLKKYQTETKPVIQNINAQVKPLDEYDPLRPKIEGTVPPLLNSPNNSKIQIKSADEPDPVLKPENTTTENKYSVAMSEGQLREMYLNADRELMKCANPNNSCTREYIDALSTKRSTAESALAIHYNYKYVKGNFIKKPQ